MKKMLSLLVVVFIVSEMLVGTNAFYTRISGKVSAEGQAVLAVQITDGQNIVLTDKAGKFCIDVHAGCDYLYYSLPSGYNSPIENGIPVFYKKIQPELKKQRINFELKKATKSQEKHAFMLWADPQIAELEEFSQLEKVIEDVNKTIASLPAEIPVHALSAGDNVFDRLHFFEKYKQYLSHIKVPFYHVIGNHDMNYDRSNELSDKSFREAFGPSHYSFNVGNIHYVVLKDIFYYGIPYHYIGYIDEMQLQWLEKDLQQVKPGSTVIVTLHIPTIYNESEKADNYNTTLSNSVMNREALYKILAPYNTHILAGHSHMQWYTQVAPNIAEHVHAAACGAWWQGEICTDGSPKGYTVYEVNGDTLSWYFKGVNQPESEQFKLYKMGADTDYPDCFIVNVYNYDPLWKVRWYENGVLMGEMSPYWGRDPLAAALYQRGNNKKYAWLGVCSTHHLFKEKPVNSDATIKVEVVDRFGNVYEKEL